MTPPRVPCSRQQHHRMQDAAARNCACCGIYPYPPAYEIPEKPTMTLLQALLFVWTAK